MKVMKTKNRSKRNRNDTRLRVLCMYKLLIQYSDETHPLTTKQIQSLMEEKYGITMHRTTVSGDIRIMQTAGIDVHILRSRQNKYYLEDRMPFEALQRSISVEGEDPDLEDGPDPS